MYTTLTEDQSYILVIFDLNNKTFTFNANRINPFGFDIRFGFTDGVNVYGDGVPIIFEDLSFGFEIQEDSTTVFSKSWPEENVKYISTDQEWIETERCNIRPVTPNKLKVWVDNAGIKTEGEYNIEI